MAIDVTAKTVINRPRAEVAAYAVDPAREREWIGGITESDVLTDGPIAVGTRVARAAKFMGRRVEYINEVVEYEPGRALAMRSIKAPFPMEVDYRFEDAADGATRMSIRIGGGPRGLMGLLSPLMGMMVRRNVTGDLRRLKQKMEDGTRNREPGT